MPKVKIQPELLNVPDTYWHNHRACPYCGYSALLMDGYNTRQCPACSKDFNITTGLKPKKGGKAWTLRSAIK